MTLRRRIFALVVASSAVGAAAVQSPVVGVASVIDGDTLEIHRQRIRLGHFPIKWDQAGAIPCERRMP